MTDNKIKNYIDKKSLDKLCLDIFKNFVNIDTYGLEKYRSKEDIGLLLNAWKRIKITEIKDLISKYMKY